MFIGYNNKHYDDLIMEAIISDVDPYLVSKAKEENNNVRLTELCNKFIEKSIFISSFI